MPDWMDPNKITDITIHCTATPEGRENTAAEVSAWDIQRFGQVSYHYVIELDGNVVQTLRHDQRGAHTGGHNTGNIGISYVGGTTTLNTGAKPKDTRTPAQKASMEALVKRLLREAPTIKRVRGHRDWPNVNKACPSFDVKSWLASVGIVLGLAPSPAPAGLPILERGDTGPEVERLQRALGMQLTASQFGIFGPLTETKVKAYQSSNGLVADGEVGPKTWGALGIA